jgi:hypothetical protein
MFCTLLEYPVAKNECQEETDSSTVKKINNFFQTIGSFLGQMSDDFATDRHMISLYIFTPHTL